jgi:Ser/Thr protein kinase RdoA (MazF antagonist)
VTDPSEVPQLLELNPDQRSRLFKILTKVLEAKPHLYAALPVQTVHADYLSPNILLEQDRVVGILDFEFATHDLRLIDYICGLNHFALFPWKDGDHWSFVQAFNMGYGEHILLTPEEASALTTAWSLQRVSSIFYWTGWLREGKATHQSVVDAVAETLLLEDWFEDNSAQLLSYSQLA